MRANHSFGSRPAMNDSSPPRNRVGSTTPQMPATKDSVPVNAHRVRGRMSKCAGMCHRIREPGRGVEQLGMGENHAVRAQCHPVPAARQGPAQQTAGRVNHRAARA
jgi:hypothetical protein